MAKTKTETESKGHKKPRVSGSYTEYFTTTSSPKLKKQINLKQLIAEDNNAILNP